MAADFMKHAESMVAGVWFRLRKAIEENNSNSKALLSVPLFIKKQL